MSRIPALLLVAYVPVIAGCGKLTSASATTASDALPSTSIPSARPLPPEYRTLAVQLAKEFKSASGDYRDDKGVSEVIAEGHSAVLALRGIQSSDADIRYVAQQGESAFVEAISRMERINALPKPPESGELLVSSFVDGFFGNVYGGYARGVEAEEKQKAILAELHPMIAAIEKGEAAQLLLPKIAEKYSASLCDSTGRIVLDFDESWGWFGPHDWLSIFNSGSALEDCTIVVQLTGANRRKKTNVHFVRNWPANTWMYARYQPGETILDRQVGNETVVEVQQVDMTIYSPKFATACRYVYYGPEKDKDIAERCKDLKFTGRYQPFVAGLLWDDQRGAYFTLDGVAAIPKCRVDVTFLRADRSKGWYWSFDSWTKGERKSFITSKGDLTFDPQTIDMTISFPGTSYKHEVSLAVNE